MALALSLFFPEIKNRRWESLNRTGIGWDRLTDIRPCLREERISRHLFGHRRIPRGLAQHAAYAQGLQERAVVEDPPDPCLVVEEGEEDKEGGDGLVRGLEGAADVDGHVGALRGMHEHEVVVVVRAQEERLPHDALVAAGELRDAVLVPGAEDVGERPVHGAEVGHELGLLPLRRADGQVERSRATYRLLHQVRQHPRSLDVGRVGRVRVGDVIGVFREVFYPHVGVRGTRGQGQKHGQEGILEQDCLPELPPLLLLKWRGIRRDYQRVSLLATSMAGRRFTVHAYQC